ncbi:MAG: TonB-dependent receptor plug domain-containing protein, partial [Bryobacteraceae bacterium]|nr:TonB-dependent receptor plug domain-containing protein [Bryobacteraceae bacterium]
MMRALICFLLAAICASADTAGSVAGRVVDPSGSSVAQARVSITQRPTEVQRSATTNGSGQYEFAALPPGEYMLTAHAAGVGSSEGKPIKIEAGKTADQNLTLELSRIATQVQVTATGLAQTVDEQSKAIDILDAQQLDRRAEYSVSEALRTVSGLRVSQLGGPGSFVRVQTRGLRSTDTSFLVDGFRFRDAASPQGDATAFISDLLLANTDRVEVLRGSGSSLYGTHATGGVVNIITDQGGGALRGDISVEGGGLGLFRGTARMSGGAFQDRLRFAGGFTHLNVTRGVDGDDRARNTTGHGFMLWQLSPATTLSGRVLIADTFAGLNDSPFALQNLPAGQLVQGIPGNTFAPAPNDPDQRRAGGQANIMATLLHNWSARASSRISYSGVFTSRDN